ncbi:MAG: magnesium chelatase [Planctomycetota bacterium]
MTHDPLPAPPAIHTLAELRAATGERAWTPRPIKQELADNLTRALSAGDDLFPGIVGYDDTVIPEIINAILAHHDMLFLGEKGQGKSKMMRMLVRFLDEWTPYLDLPSCPVHEDPTSPITEQGKRALAELPAEEVPIAWWHRSNRYAERLAPGTKFADIIGEIDPAKLLQGESMSAEGALHFGMVPRMHRGIFAMNELPDLDDLVQVGLFNILEERDVQIRGYPVSFDIDTLVLFSANPATYNRSGKVIPQLKDRIGSVVQTHYPRERDLGIEIMQREAGVDLGGPYPVAVPRFMLEVCEQLSIVARKSQYVDHASGVSARFSIANYKTMIANARRRGIQLGDAEAPAVPRISDLAHFEASAQGKLELDMMGSHQMTERQVLQAILAKAIADVFEEYVTDHGLETIADVFSKGVKIEVGDTLPSDHYEQILKRVPPAWEKAFEINPSEQPAVRASCVEFVLAGLWATDRVSRGERFGTVTYEL